jgi:hypothetical protein
MQILNRREGVLNVLVSSQGTSIEKGECVVIETIVDNFKNIAIRVKAPFKTVFLPFYSTDIDWLLKNK